MKAPLHLSEVRFTAAHPDRVLEGLVGYVSCVVNGSLKLDGLMLRRTRDGRPVLSFPSRRDRNGVDHPIVRPLSRSVQAEIERQVFDHLGIREAAG